MGAGVIDQQNRAGAKSRRRLSAASVFSLVAHIALVSWAAGFLPQTSRLTNPADLELTFISLQTPAASPAAALAMPEPSLPEPIIEAETPPPEPDPEPLAPPPVIKPATVRSKPRPRKTPPPSPAKEAPRAPVPQAPSTEVAQETAAPALPAAQGRVRPGPEASDQAKNLLAAYKSQVARRIHSVKRYPFEARRNREEGRVKVRFVITARGSVEGLELIQSSGHPSLDQAAMDAIHRAEPFPPLPAETGLSELVIVAPITFELDIK